MARLAPWKATVPLLWIAVFTLLLTLPVLAASPYDDDFKSATLDKKWTVHDINPGQPGGAVVKDGALVMTNYGAGTDTNDTALFVAQPISGDFSATLKVLSIPETSDDASTGLMVRQSADPDAPMVYLFADMIDWREGVKMRARLAPGENRGDVAKVRYFQLPVWLRLIRQGDAFLAYRSDDGQVFTFVGSVRVPMTDPVLVGPSVWAWRAPANGGFLAGIGSVTEFRVDLPPSGTGRILVKVTDDQGNVIRGAGALLKDSTGKVVATTLGQSAVVSASGSGAVFGLHSEEVILPFVSPGTYTVVPLALGYEGEPQTVSVSSGQDSTLEVKVKSLPTLSLATDALPPGSQGWVVKPDVDSTDGAPMAPDYKEDTSWVKVTVPEDLSQGNPVNPNSYFWYRGHITLPSEWRSAYGNRDLIFNLPKFGTAGTWIVAWNGTPIGGVINNDPTPMVVPNGAVNWTGDNVIAIMGRATKATVQAGMATAPPTLTISSIPAGAIAGKVVDSDKKPVSWVRVIATSTNTEWGPFSKFMDTKADGSFCLAGLPPGTYTVSLIQRQDFASLPKPQSAEVKEGQITSVNFTIPLLPTLDLVKENGYQWLCLSQGTFDPDAFKEDHSAVNDPETGFQPWDVSNKNGDWNAFDSGERIYGWLRLHLKLPADWKAKYGKNDLRFWWFNWDNNEVSYWNGVKIGGVGNWREETGVPGGWVGGFYQSHRDYIVPNHVVNWDGDNVIAMHVYQSVGDAGFSIWRPKVTPVVPPAPAVTYGDLNGDGNVTTGDAILALRAGVGLLTLSPDQQTAGDVNGDGKVNVQDAILILRFAVRLIDTFPIQR